MKHLKLFFALFAMLALGVGNVWGAETTVSWTATANSLGKTISNVNGTAVGTIKTGSFEWNYTRTLVSLKSGKSDYVAMSSGYMQLGSSNAGETLQLTTSNIPGTIKSVAVDCWSKNGAHNLTISVGGTSYYSGATPTSGSTKSGTGTSSGTIDINFTISKNNALYIKSITVVYEETSGSGSTEPVLTSIQISGELTKDTYEEGDELDLTGLTVLANYESGDPKDVTNDVEWSYEPLTAGQTSVTVTATYEGLTAIKTINDLTVTEHVVTPGEKCTGTLGYAFWGLTAEKLTATANEINYTKEFDDVTVNIKNGQKANAYFKSDHTRVYSGGYTMTFSVPNGYIITNIAFTAIDSYWDGNHTANVGTMSDNKNWTGANQNVTITFDGSCRIASICVTYKADVKYALTITEPTEGGTLVVKDGENTLASGAEIYEGTKLTVTTTPATGYEEGVVVVKNASDEDVTATVYADGVLTMPAYAVTISATFDKKPCTLLATPTVSATTTYSSATLTWDAVANAAKYSVKVGTADAVETTETSYDITGLTAETTYTYQVQAIAEADQDTYCDSEVAEGTFTTATAPTATLTLSDIEGTTTKTGALNGTITLPTEAAECSKTFVGWDADENCDHAPTYAPGAEYTFTTLDPTLYAVYADGEAGEALQWTIKNDDLKVLDSSQSSGYAKYAGDQEKDGVTFNITSVMPATGENVGKIQMQAEKATIYNKTAMPGNIISIAIDGVDLSVYEGTEVISSTPSSGAITKNSEVYNFSSGKRYFHLKKSTKSAGYANSITVTYASAPTYSNYSTTCAAALEKPTFSVAEGTYTEAKSIVLNATEGDIYYTLDGTDPTASSTQYTTAIVLDECGTTTIKAIAISTESQSPIASATYTINLPIPANSASDPYTSDEAKDVYASGCYNDEWVYVTGTVQTAQYYSSSGSYTITLTDGFQFYYFFKDDQQTKFADGEIETGDVLVACGQLSEHNGNCQLAQNCYLVSIEEYTDPKTDISNTIDNPYTVTQADELIDDITSDLTKTVFVKGVVTGFATNKVTIRDTREGTEYIELYKHTLATGITPLSQGDLIIATGTMAKYNGTTYQMNEGCQVVWKKAAATIEIANVSLEVGETHTIAATIAPAEAASAVTYTIKSGSEYISLTDNVITANAVGTATITATIADCDDYMGNSVDFTVNVTPESTSDEVVILAELDGKWYAMKGAAGSGTGQLAALEVTYFNGTLYNVAEADKASITWTRTIVDGKATFVNNGKYLKGKDGNLSLVTTTDENCKWTSELGFYTTGNNRTFIYRDGYNFKNYSVQNVGASGYSGFPEVVVPVYATGDIVYTRTVTNKYGTICLPYSSASTSGATFFEVVGQEDGNKVYLASVTELEAGVPYIFEKTANTITVTCQGEAVAEAASANGLVGNFTNEFIVPANNYILYSNAFIPADGTTNKVNAYRAYLDMDAVTGGAPVQMPGRRYIGMDVQGENVETGVEDLFTTDAPVKVIENGQLIIIRDGVKYNVQGQKL